MNTKLNMVKILIFVILVFLAVSHATFHITTSITEGIPDNSFTSFNKIGENFYFIESKNKTNWFGAANACRKMGANLASIESADEAETLYAYLKTLKDEPDFWGFWLSGHDMENVGEYKWLGTGNTLSYTNWAKGEPSGGTEHCLLIRRECNEVMITNGGTYQYNFWTCRLPQCNWSKCWNLNWNDGHCSSKMNYICKASHPMTVSVSMWS